MAETPTTREVIDLSSEEQEQVMTSNGPPNYVFLRQTTADHVQNVLYQSRVAETPEPLPPPSMRLQKTHGWLVLERETGPDEMLRSFKSGYGTVAEQDRGPRVWSNWVLAKKVRRYMDLVDRRCRYKCPLDRSPNLQPRLQDEPCAGVWRSGHVEMKAGMFATEMFLRVLNIRAASTTTVVDIERLKTAIQRSGKTYVVKIYISRAPCGRCKRFINRLRESTSPSATNMLLVLILSETGISFSICVVPHVQEYDVEYATNPGFDRYSTGMLDDEGNIILPARLTPDPDVADGSNQAHTQQGGLGDGSSDPIVVDDVRPANHQWRRTRQIEWRARESRGRLGYTIHLGGYADTESGRS